MSDHDDGKATQRSMTTPQQEEARKEEGIGGSEDRQTSQASAAEKPLPLPSESPPMKTAQTDKDMNDVGAKATIGTASVTTEVPPPLPPSIRKRNLKGTPKGILKPAPPPTKAFSFRRDILQQLNTRLAQQGVNVQVPVPQGSLAGTAQGTAQAAGSLLGGMLRRVSGFASSNYGAEDQSHHQINNNNGARGIEHSSFSTGSSAATSSHRVASLSSISSDATAVSNNSSTNTVVPSVHTTPTNNLPQPSSSARPLRKVRFTVSSMTVTYPISGAISPGEEDVTRRRIEQEHRLKLKERRERKWAVSELEQLYRECCRTREELPLRKMRQVFQDAKQASPPAFKTMDLSFVPLDRQAIEPVADLLSVDFGLQKLVLENCGLTDEGVKSILHALLVSGSLSSLSLASNKRVKYHGWRYVGIYMRRAKSLKYLDLSENSINRASVEHILGALNKGEGSTIYKGKMPLQNADDQEEEDPLTVKAKLLSETLVSEATSLTSLRMENCGLKTPSLELLSHAVRYSDLSHLSLRRNRINQVGAVALAVMLKDYPDNQVATAEQATPPLMYNEVGSSSTSQLQGQQRSAVENGRGRSRGGEDSLLSAGRSSSPGLPQIPIIVSSPGGGVTRRTLPAQAIAALQEASSDNFTRTNDETGANRADSNMDTSRQYQTEPNHTEEAALAIYHAQRAKRILSSMPKMGNLLTLDLKSNDIRGGVVYLSHALKKNRTLKVLNLSDNNIEVMGLVAIADALKYNSTLETLDLSHNPCSGPALDGITTLRNAFTLNSNLKRLFLSDTELSSEGAIALAEFLPEARSLIHLDLTENLQIDIAGVMAMAVSVKMNKSLRCLDLNIPPNAPDFARLSQDILNSCIRNTELAQRRAQQKGVKAPIPAPIYKSALARAAKEKEESVRLQTANQQLEQHAENVQKADQARSVRSSPDGRESAVRITNAAQECVLVLRELMEREEEQDKERMREREVVKRADGSVAGRPMGEFARDLLLQSKHLRSKLKKALGVMQEGEMLEKALQVNDDLEAISSQLYEFYAGSKSVDSLTSEERPNGHETDATQTLVVPTTTEEEGLSSPNFSIGSSDDEEEEDFSRSAIAATSAQEIVGAAAESTLAGLRIDDAPSEEAQRAAREAPVEQQVDPKSDGVVKRAKGQLSEEGEIFRRARSLSIGDDREDEEGPADRDEGSPSPISNRQASPLKTRTAPFAAITGHREGAESASTTADEANDDVSSSAPIASEDRTDVSGEELRRELLETDVPRRATQSPVSPNEVAEE